MNGIEEDLCLRCNKFREDWEHVWLGEANEEEVSAMIKNAVYEYELKLIEEKKKEEAEIVRDINFEFIRILEQPSVVLIGKNREWELLGGVYNHNFNKISKRKDYKRAIENLWCYCYEQIRLKIWKKRCETIYEIEKERV